MTGSKEFLVLPERAPVSTLVPNLVLIPERKTPGFLLLPYPSLGSAPPSLPSSILYALMRALQTYSTAHLQSLPFMRTREPIFISLRAAPYSVCLVGANIPDLPFERHFG